MKCEQVLTAKFDVSDEPIKPAEVEGLEEAIGNVKDTHEGEFVRCENRIGDYYVRWNEPTETVRCDFVLPRATYEVADE